MSASQVVLSLGLTIAAEWIFVHYTHALQQPYPDAAVPAKVDVLIQLQHHGILVSAMVLGCVMALIASMLSGTDTAPREVVTTLLSPVLVFASIAAFLPIAGHRLLMFAALVVFAGLGMWVRKFGARAGGLGLLVWAGVFSAFFFRTTVTEAKIGWIAAELAIGTLVALLVRLTLFRPRPDLALRLMRRSMAAREATALRLAATHLQHPEPAHQSRSAAKLLGLNQTSLMIDHRAALVSPEGQPSGEALARSSYLADLSPPAAHRRVGHRKTPAALPRTGGRGLRALADGDPGTAVALLEDAGRRSDEPGAAGAHIAAIRAAALRVAATRQPHSADATAAPLDSAAVPFIGGWLPGSLIADSQASRQSLPKWLDPTALDAPLRSAIQLAVAMTAAIAAGDALDGSRFYWAMLAVFAAFMGGSNSYENLQRALARVAGTILGIFLGFAAVHVTGGGATIALILVVLFIGFYVTRFDYFFFVLSITIMVSELYAEFGEYSHHLLYVRVEETAIGGAIAVIVLMVVIPLRRERVFTVALGNYLTALQNFLRAAHEHPVEGDPRIALHAQLRSIDHSYQTLRAIGSPPLMRRISPATRTRTALLAQADQARHAARGWTQQATAAPDEATARRPVLGDSPIGIHAPADVAVSPITTHHPTTVTAAHYLSTTEAGAREIAAQLSTLHPDRWQPVAAGATR